MHPPFVLNLLVCFVCFLIYLLLSYNLLLCYLVLISPALFLPGYQPVSFPLSNLFLRLQVSLLSFSRFVFHEMLIYHHPMFLFSIFPWVAYCFLLVLFLFLPILFFPLILLFDLRLLPNCQVFHPLLILVLVLLLLLNLL